MWLGASLSAVGAQLTTIAVGLQVYDLTRSTFNVGLIGLFALVPLVALGLYGGSIVDAHDRRLVIICSSTGLLLVALVFAAQAWLKLENVWLLYLLVALQYGCFAVNSPARTAIMPRLLSADQLPAANALSTLSSSVGQTMGPLLAGLLVAWWGFGAAYTAEAALLVVALITLVALPSLPPLGQVRRSGLASVLEGLNFLRSRPNIRMTFIVDLLAMILAMPRVLFPAIGVAVLGGGATTVGILSAGIAAGSIITGLLSGRLGRISRQGRAVLVAIVGWGVSITAFGVVLALSSGPGPGGSVRWLLWPAVVFLALAGAADAVSAVFRMTILQSATPDAMRGRLQGVFVVVVAGGPRLGDLLLGTVAHLTRESITAIVGGLACVVAVLVVAALQPAFGRYDAREPTA
jgi:MFS family permease